MLIFYRFLLHSYLLDRHELIHVAFHLVFILFLLLEESDAFILVQLFGGAFGSIGFHELFLRLLLELSYLRLHFRYLLLQLDKKFYLPVLYGFPIYQTSFSSKIFNIIYKVQRNSCIYTCDYFLKSYHFGVISATLLTLYPIEMKISLHRFMQALIAQNTYLFTFQLFRYLILCFVNNFLYVTVLGRVHFLNSHPTNWTIDIVVHGQTINMDKMPTGQGTVELCGILQIFHTDGAI